MYPHFLQSLSFRFLTGVDPAACCVGLPLTTWLDPCFIALSWSRQYSASVLNPLPMNQFPNLASIAACQCQFFVTIPRLHRELQYGICPPKRRHNYFNCSCSYATLPTVASFSIPGPPHEKINALLALSLVDVPCESIDVGVPKFFTRLQVGELSRTARTSSGDSQRRFLRVVRIITSFLYQPARTSRTAAARRLFVPATVLCTHKFLNSQ